jgi:hypothetical protein
MQFFVIATAFVASLASAADSKQISTPYLSSSSKADPEDL